MNVKTSNHLLLGVLLIFLSAQVLARETGFSVLFYNVENLFDTINTPHKNDSEFTPQGNKEWNRSRYYRKLQNIYKVVAAAGKWDTPKIVALCEVENRAVLEDLISKTPFNRLSYKICHFESPDRRGIDVAILYDSVYIEKTEAFPIKVSLQGNRATRDILHFKFKYAESSFYLFVNHWPSRYGGQYKSEKNRLKASDILRIHIDSVVSGTPKARIIVTGDFNDTPTDESLKKLCANTSLFNLSNNMLNEDVLTISYGGEWFLFDQFMVSGNLLNASCDWAIKENRFEIIKTESLLKETKNGNIFPFRTYNGPHYTGGYSDHLPILLELFTD
ncbi:endonuclease [Bacteroidales bacterium]|nr:endonuclease [Bacteroidales bacterium]